MLSDIQNSRKAILLRAIWVLGVVALTGVSQAAGPELPSRFRRYPFSVRSLTVGHPNHGYQLRAKKLRSTETLEVRRQSEPQSYGHPALVLMLTRSAKQIAKSIPGSVLFVGDLSYERGGRLFGHTSHQSGRDADVAFYVRDREGRSARASRFVKFRGDGRATDGSGLVFDDYRNWLLVQSWVRDERAGLSHIFVSAPLRARLLRYAKTRRDFRPYVEQAAKLLKQPARASAHADHFHVRIACPEDQLGLCKNESRR